jgi:hypothetical protein
LSYGTNRSVGRGHLLPELPVEGGNILRILIETSYNFSVALNLAGGAATSPCSRGAFCATSTLDLSHLQGNFLMRKTVS